MPSTWDLRCPAVPGLGSGGTAKDWSLEDCAERLESEAEGVDALVGHDLGGVLAAMLARPGQTVILSGTALRFYWWGIRGSALPVIHRVFYQRYGGRHFLSRGSLPAHSEDLLEAFGDHGEDWPDRMRQIAQAMRPPPDLSRKLKTCKVHLIWGEKDPWYPKWVARSVRRSTGGALHMLPCGHFAPWEDPSGFSRVLRELSLQP